MPSTVIFTLSPAASYTTVLFFGAFGAIFDLASFSFQVPVNASSAKHTATATKHSAIVNTIVFAFMSPPLRTKLWAVLREDCSCCVEDSATCNDRIGQRVGLRAL